MIRERFPLVAMFSSAIMVFAMVAAVLLATASVYTRVPDVPVRGVGEA